MSVHRHHLEDKLSELQHKRHQMEDLMTELKQLRREQKHQMQGVLHNGELRFSSRAQFETSPFRFRFRGTTRQNTPHVGPEPLL